MRSSIVLLAKGEERCLRGCSRRCRPGSSLSSSSRPLLPARSGRDPQSHRFSKTRHDSSNDGRIQGTHVSAAIEHSEFTVVRIIIGALDTLAVRTLLSAFEDALLTGNASTLFRTIRVVNAGIRSPAVQVRFYIYVFLQTTLFCLAKRAQPQLTAESFRYREQYFLSASSIPTHLRLPSLTKGETVVHSDTSIL